MPKIMFLCTMFNSLEYEIHRQIVNKLKVKGMNAVFGLQVSLSLRLVRGSCM
jgi:hypothetical protein